MGLVEVDAVGLQALEGCLDGLLDVFRGETLFAVTHVHADFGRDNHSVALAAAREPFAEDGFGFASDMAGDPSRIDIGGVDEIQAGIVGGVEEAEGIAFIHGPAEDVSAQHDCRDFDCGVTQFSFLHNHSKKCGTKRLRLSVTG